MERWIIVQGSLLLVLSLGLITRPGELPSVPIPPAFWRFECHACFVP